MKLIYTAKEIEFLNEYFKQHSQEYNRNELVDDILVYLDKLRYMAVSNKRNNAYVKGVRDAMKLVQSFKDQEVTKDATDTLDS